MKIAIAGGTGTIGALVVAAATAAGHQPVVLARSTGVNLFTGQGLDQALGGVDAVIDVSNTLTMRASQAVLFFTTVTKNLLEAGHRAGTRNHVALSIIGALGVDASYYAGKAAQERMLLVHPGKYTLLRAAQFHEFVAQNLQRTRLGPVQFVPKMRSQPIAGSEVATELLALAAGEPRGVVADLAGPREENMARLVAAYLRFIGDSRRVVEIPIPGSMGRAMRDGSLLPSDQARRGTLNFDTWLRNLER